MSASIYHGRRPDAILSELGATIVMSQSCLASCYGEVSIQLKKIVRQQCGNDRHGGQFIPHQLLRQLLLSLLTASALGRHRPLKKKLRWLGTTSQRPP